MTEEQVRIIVRSEIGRTLARAVAGPESVAPSPLFHGSDVAAWVERLPAGETGLASEWLARFRADTGAAEPSTPIGFGIVLRAHAGRLVSRKMNGGGTFVYTRLAHASA